MKSFPVFILHQNDELKLIQLQNEIINTIKNNNPACKVLKNYPLWADCSSFLTEDKIKSFRQEITSVRLGSAFLKDNSYYISVNFEGNVEGSKTEYKTEIEILKLFGSSDLKEILFEADIRIFRFAVGFFEDNSYWVCDSVWKKIK